MRRREWQTILAAAALIVLVGLGLVIWRSGLWRAFAERSLMLQWIGSLGPWGPAVIVAANALQVLFAPIPGQIVGLVAGYLYGVAKGTLLCSAGLAIGTLCAMWLARRLGRPLVERIVGQELLRRVDGYAERRGALAFFLIFLLPFLPDDLCCFIAGLTPLGLGELLVLAVVGRLPGVIISTLIGAQAGRLGIWELGVVALLTLLPALLFARYQKQLERAMFNLLERLNPREPPSEGR